MADTNKNTEMENLEAQFSQHYSSNFPQLIDPIHADELTKLGAVFSIDVDNEPDLSDSEDIPNEQPAATTHMDQATLSELQGGCEQSNNKGDVEYIEPFELLKKRMEDISGDGGVHKMIQKHGSGPLLPETAYAKVHYQIYQEYADEPYDSSRLRGQLLCFRVGKGQVIPGLEVAVRSMKKGELSKYLVSPEYNLGETGCPPRVPKGTTVLMEVELIDYSDRAGEDEYYSMPMEERKCCDMEIVKTLLEGARKETKSAFNARKYKSAMFHTKRAIDVLEEHRLKDASEESFQSRELLRLYINAALCNLKLSNSRAALSFAGQALNINRQSCKAHYIRGRAFMLLLEFDKAEKSLKTAHKLEPNDKLINEALIELNQTQSQFSNLEKLTYKKMFSSSSSGPENEHVQKPIRSQEAPKCTPEFEKLAQQQIENFINNKDLREMSMPDCNLTIGEIHCILSIAEKHNLAVASIGTGNALHYKIRKKQK